MEKLVEIHAIAKGRVQGVCFRASVLQHARGKGLVGTVKNLPDGSVEIVVQGDKSLIDDFFEKIKQESWPVEVSSLEISLETPKVNYDKFSIIY